MWSLGEEGVGEATFNMMVVWGRWRARSVYTKQGGWDARESSKNEASTSEGESEEIKGCVNHALETRTRGIQPLFHG